MTQSVLPNSTSSNTNWTANGAATEWECVDETIAGTNGDTDYVVTLVQGAVLKLGLPAAKKPADLSTITVKISARVTPATSVATCDVALMEGSTVIATVGHNLIAPAGGGTTFTTYTLAVTALEAAAITDYANLFVRLTASTLFGSPSGRIRVSTVEYNSGDGSLVLSAGTFALGGNATGLLAGRKLAVGAGAFALGGNATGLRASRKLPVSVGAFALSGNAANLLASRLLSAVTGSFALVGNSAQLLASRVLQAASGSFALNGNSANLLAGRLLSVSAAAFLLSGSDANLLAARYLQAQTGVFVLTGHPVTLTPSTTPPAGSTIMIDVAEAIVAALNGGSWSQAFTAERIALPEFTLPDIATLRVPVAMRSTEIEHLTRSSSATTVEIDIGVVKKLVGTGPEGQIISDDIDPFVILCDEIVNYFHNTRLTGVPAAYPAVTRPDPVYDQDKLERERAFLSVIRLEFKVFG